MSELGTNSNSTSNGPSYRSVVGSVDGTIAASAKTTDRSESIDGAECDSSHEHHPPPPKTSASTPALRPNTASVLSGEEADSEPSSANSSLMGSTEHLSRLGSRRIDSTIPQTPNRTRASSAAYGAYYTDETDMQFDREVQLVTSTMNVTDTTAPPSPANARHNVKGWKISSSSLNLLLSSHLSHHFNVPTPPTKPPSLWRRILLPSQPFSSRNLTIYTCISIGLYYAVRAAAVRSRHNRTMVGFLLPFIIREAPQIFAFGIIVSMIRTAPQLSKELNPKLLLSWFVNVLSLFGLADMFRRLIRVGAMPFRNALQSAQIGVPRTDPNQEDVLTIVPVQQRSETPLPSAFPNDTQPDPLQVSAFAATDETTTNTTMTTTAANAAASLLTDVINPSEGDEQTTITSSSPASLPSSTAATAYKRIGHMTPLRWFLSMTQLTKTLAWFEEIQWRTGVVYEKIFTRQKTHALKLDIYRPKVTKPGTLLPIFLYIHGGGWITGHRSFHSLAMLYAIAKAGFMVASVNYRLSPWVKHPTHLMDCKRALAWLRTHAASFGGDASFVVVGGESAGAHLACLLALTPNVLHLQPGLEQIDTSVQGVVDLYGCHDFTDSHYHIRVREDPQSLLGGFEAYLHLMVMGAKLSESKELYEMASPLFRLQWFHESPTATVPPFFGSHGEHDELIPVEDSDEFYALLKEKRIKAQNKYLKAKAAYEANIIQLKKTQPTAPLPLPPLPPLPIQDVFIRVPHASHAYNNVMSPRSFALNDSVTVWLTSLLKHHHVRQAELAERKSRLHALDGYEWNEWSSPSSVPPTTTTYVSHEDQVAPTHTPPAIALEMRQVEEVVQAELEQEQQQTTLTSPPSTTSSHALTPAAGSVSMPFKLIPKL